MKITFLALHLGFGGIEKYIITIANILSEKYEVEIISTYKTTPEPAFPLSNRVKVTYLIEGMVPNKDKFKSAINKKHIFNIIKEGLYSYKLLRLKNKRNKIAIQNCHSNIIISTRDYHNEMIQKYASKDIVKITSEHNHPCGNQDYIKRVVNSCKGFDYMLPISKELTNFYDKQLVNTNTKVIYIPFCIDEPTCKDIPDFSKPVYISVGRLSKEKGVLDLIHIFSEIVKKQPDAILHLVGDGKLMPEVKKLSSQLYLEENLMIHGFLHKKEIDDLYCHSSLYLMASYTEAFGFVLLEAMACGLPCIAFDSAQGANEIIKNGENGILISNRDFDSYVNKVITTEKDKTLLKEMSLSAKKSLDIYSYERTRQEWLEFIGQIER